jgi:hypothetical protein
MFARGTEWNGRSIALEIQTGLFSQRKEGTLLLLPVYPGRWIKSTDAGL